MTKSRTATASEETRGVPISHRPPSDFAPESGKVLLKNHIDGRLVVGAVNNVMDKCQGCMLEYISDTLTTRKCYDLALMIAKKVVEWDSLLVNRKVFTLQGCIFKR